MKNLKQIGILLLCSLLFMRVMVAPVIFLQYEFNKEYIIQNYCVNKNRPQLHCNGKCYLAQKLKAAEQRDEAQSKIQAFKLMVEVFHEDATHFQSFAKPFSPNLISHFIYRNSYHYTTLFSLLKPPQVNAEL